MHREVSGITVGTSERFYGNIHLANVVREITNTSA